MIINNVFPTDKNEIELVKFIGRFKILSIKDIPYFLTTTYAPKRILRLTKNGIIYKFKKHLLLANNGKQFLQAQHLPYYSTRYEDDYIERMSFISHIAAVFHNNPFIDFIPSYEIKNKNVFTEKSRSYIGIFNILGTKYLTYHIRPNNTSTYISSVIYDIQKEPTYKNILVLVDDIKRISLNDFVFGNNTVLICEDTDEELLKLKFIYQLDWKKIVTSLYKSPAYISEHNYCNYQNNKNRYISTFALLDTEKINKILNFIYSNEHKHADIICSKELYKLIKPIIPTAKYKIIDFEKSIERDLQIYD